MGRQEMYPKRNIQSKAGTAVLGYADDEVDPFHHKASHISVVSLPYTKTKSMNIAKQCSGGITKGATILSVCLCRSPQLQVWASIWLVLFSSDGRIHHPSRRPCRDPLLFVSCPL
jgi:hypothetical protein